VALGEDAHDADCHGDAGGWLGTAGVERDVRGWEKASDHAPTWITLAKKSARQIKRQ
jgi:hypothetical protein